MASPPLKSSAGRERKQPTPSGGQLPLSALLVELKVARARCLKSRKLGGPLYEDFCDSAVRLYEFLDRRSIEELESCTEGE